MVTKEQFVQGVLIFLDNEVMPALKSTSKALVGLWIILVTSRIEKLLPIVLEHPIIKMTDIVNENGMIDISRLSDAMNSYIDRYGEYVFDVPAVGNLKFSKSDISKLVTYVKGGNL